MYARVCLHLNVSMRMCNCVLSVVGVFVCLLEFVGDCLLFRVCAGGWVCVRIFS